MDKNQVVHFLASNDPQSSELRSVAGIAIESVPTLKDDSLDIRFVSEHRLFIPFNVYETWGIKSNESIRVVSVASGGVAIWL